MQGEADSVSSSEMIVRAARLAAVLEKEAARIEAAGRIPDDIASLLTEAGFFRMTQPRHLGGYGLSPRTLWEVVFHIASACPSTAWVLSLVGANLLMVGRFPRSAQQAVFEGDQPAIVTLLTGGVGTNVQLQRVDGGVRVSGTWRYASGIDIASWAGLLVNVPAVAQESARPCLILVPQSAFSIDHASWKVMGMRGTGSKNISLQDVFVPDERTMDWSAMQSGGASPGAEPKDCVHALPLNVLFAMSVLAPTLGVASAIAKEVTNLVSTRVSAGTQERQANEKNAQIDVATGIATMDVLRTNLLADTDRLMAIVGSGNEVDPQTRALMRMKIAVSSRLALSTAQALLADVGGSLLQQGTRIERAFRDIHAMSSHFLLQPAYIGEAFGRLSMGLSLPPGARI
jgi:alkylation response protein AidB-like acyl-CoA dehydrogenase